MGRIARSWKTVVVVAALTATVATGSCPGEPLAGSPCAGRPERAPGDQLMLSLQVARARKDGRGIARYKSLVRQQKLLERRPPAGKSAPPLARGTATGLRPPWGR
jgi:hypothetical protein